MIAPATPAQVAGKVRGAHTRKPSASMGTNRMGSHRFEERIRGSHHLFDKDGMVEIVNLQSRGGHAKPYQVKQVRQFIMKYRLGGDD